MMHKKIISLLLASLIIASTPTLTTFALRICPDEITTDGTTLLPPPSGPSDGTTLLPPPLGPSDGGILLPPPTLLPPIYGSDY